MLALGVLAACGTSAASTVDLDAALTVELPGFVPGAGRGTPTTLCDAEPTGSGATPPPLSGELGASATVFYEQAQSTVEAYAWPAASAEAAREFVGEAAAAARGCEFELFTDAHTDGDGSLDSGISDVQTVEPWEGSGWTGVRVHREVSGPGSGEQVERRLLRSEEIVLLVVLRSDRLGEEQSEPVDALLEQVHDSLR